MRALILAILTGKCLAALYGMDLGEGTARMAVLEDGNFRYYSSEAYARDTTPEEDATVYKRLLAKAGVKSTEKPSICVSVSALADPENLEDLEKAAALANFDIHSTIPRWMGAIIAAKHETFEERETYRKVTDKDIQVLLVDVAKADGEIVLVEIDPDLKAHEEYEILIATGFADCADCKDANTDLASIIQNAYSQGLKDNNLEHSQLNVSQIIVTGSSTNAVIILKWLKESFAGVSLFHDAEISPWLAVRGAAIESARKTRNAVLFRDEL